MVNALRRAIVLPSPIFGLCALFDFGTIVVFIVESEQCPCIMSAAGPTSESNSQDNRGAKPKFHRAPESILLIPG